MAEPYFRRNETNRRLDKNKLLAPFLPHMYCNNLQRISVHKTVEWNFWFKIHLILLKKTTKMWSGCALKFFLLRNHIVYDASISPPPQWILQKTCYEEWIILISANYHQMITKRGVKIVQKQLPSPVYVWLFATKLDRFFPKRESSWEILLSQVSINKARGAQCHIMIKFFWFGRSNCIDTLRLFVWKIV